MLSASISLITTTIIRIIMSLFLEDYILSNIWSAVKLNKRDNIQYMANNIYK